MHPSARKKILWATFIISGLGLFSELSGFVRGGLAFTLGSQVEFIYLLKSLHLSILTIRFFESHNADNSLSVNFLTLTFHAVFLIGGILLAKSGEKETRLLRFSFAVLLIANVMALVNTAAFYFLDNNYPFSFFYQVLGPLRVVVLVGISYWVLRTLNGTRSLVLANDEHGNPDYVNAGRWTRFFHLAFDTILCLMIFSPFLYMFGASWLQRLANATEDRVAVFVIMIIWRLIYYPFFEGLFGATPAKMLTETRVVRSLTRPLVFSDTIYRTLSRFVPFEPFSFFGTKGWHDDWTLTRVVKENRTGVAGGRYFLLIPALIGVGMLGYIAYEAYDRYRSYQYRRVEHATKIAAIQAELRQLSDQTLIELEDRMEEYSSNAVYLRIINTGPDSVKVAVLAIESHRYYNWLSLYDAFLTQDGYLPEISIPKAVLMNLYQPDYDQHSHRQSSEDVSQKLEDAKAFRQSLLKSKRYLIKQISKIDAPYLAGTSGGSIYTGSISLNINNCGWAGQVTEIKNLEGDIAWNPTPYPIVKMGHEQYSSCSIVHLSGSNYPYNKSYKFQFTVTDLLNRRQRFEVTGFNLSWVMRRIE